MATSAGSVSIDGSQLAREMVIQVNVSPIFGRWHWRLIVAQPLLLMACWILRCQFEVTSREEGEKQ